MRSLPQKIESFKEKFGDKRMTFSEMNSRAQVNLTDTESQPDGDLKWILVYQDYLTKFVQFHPVTSKRTPEIACQLLDIFSIFGAPSILQSDNGREFVNSVTTELRAVWDGLCMENLYVAKVKNL